MSEPIQNISRETIAAIVNLISPYVSVNHELLFGALFASEIDLSPVRALVQKQAHVGNTALVALIEHGLAKQLDFVHPNWTEQTIIEITRKIAQSGNVTWYCKLLNREQPLYIRQSNKFIFLEHYPEIETMALDFPIKAEIKVYTEPEDNFLALRKVLPNGLLSLRQVKAMPEDLRRAAAIQKLGDLTQAVFCDFETTGIGDNAEIVQYGIVQKDYGTSEHFHALIKPEEPELLTIPYKGKTAQSIHGISAEKLANEEAFPAIYETLKAFLHGKTVVTYGDFDIRILTQVCKRHGLEPIVPNRHIDLMQIYAEYHGEPSTFKHGDYKWQSLEAAYSQIAEKPLVGAHDALVDALAMQTIVSKMQSSIESED